MVSDGTLLYTNSGEVWDPKAQKLLGRYDSSLFYEAGLVADATAKRTFIQRTVAFLREEHARETLALCIPHAGTTTTA
jgi:hypothetical protein